MANNAYVYFTGALGADPELRYTASGTPVANMNVAVTERVKNGDRWEDGVTTWYRVAAWRDLAENITESLGKGDLVTVTGRLKNRPYEHNGEKRWSLEVEADTVGVSLARATVKIAKAQRGQPQQQKAQADPWGSQPQGWDEAAADSAPF